MQKFDVIVIGASLAGCTTALNLAQSGLKVALLERNPGPKSKACGCGLSHKAAALLGLPAFLNKTPHQILNGYNVITRELESIPLPGYSGIGIDRCQLDLIMLERLSSYKQVLFEDRAKVESIEQLSNGHYQVLYNEKTISAKTIVLATGNNSKIFNQLHIPAHENSIRTLGCSLEVQMVNCPKTVVVFPQKTHVVCLTPLGAGRANLSLMTKRGQHVSPLTANSLSQALLAPLSNESYEVVSPIQFTSNIGRFSRNNQHANIFLVGDSIEQLDPVGGMGMTFAVLSALITSKAIIKLQNNANRRVRRVLLLLKLRIDIYRTKLSLLAYTRMADFFTSHTTLLNRISPVLRLPWMASFAAYISTAVPAGLAL